MSPEIVGPSAGATEMTIEMLPMVLPRDSGGTSVMTVVISSGIMMAVPVAWMTRPKTSSSSPGESAQFSVLNHLAVHGREETPASLADIFLVTKGAMTNTLQRLEGRALISVTGDPTDARRKKVAITPEGHKAYDACVAALRPMMESMREAFTQDEFQDALPFLNALRVWLVETRNEMKAAGKAEPEA